MPAKRSLQIKLYPLLSSLATVTDLISPILTAHHQKVAFIAAILGQTLGLPAPELQQLALAGAVHDIGGLSLRRRLDSFTFEVRKPQRHTVPGYVLLSGFPPFAGIARLVRFHHTHWQKGRGEEDQGEPVSRLSHFINLADRIAVRIDPRLEILSQNEKLIKRIRSGTGKIFIPEQVEAFREVAAKDSFWLELTSPEINKILQERLPLDELTLSWEELPGLAELFRRIIDFRSRFTANHSSGVAAVGMALAEKSGRDKEYIERIRLTGLMHDIGKLVVPAEILGKQGPLSKADFAVIRKHPYYSAWILRDVEGFREISRWAALHHERLDGSGYPYRPPEAELPDGARIMAVADTFTALTEDRPYRCAMTMPGANLVMRHMADYRKLDHHYVALIHDHFEEFDYLRENAQEAADAVHLQFMSDCRLLDSGLDPSDYCPA